MGQGGCWEQADASILAQNVHNGRMAEIESWAQLPTFSYKYSVPMCVLVLLPWHHQHVTGNTSSQHWNADIFDQQNTHTGRNREKISGKFCMLPKIFPKFFPVHGNTMNPANMQTHQQAPTCTIATLAKHHENFFGTFCIFPKIFLFFFSKWANNGRINIFPKFSHDFSHSDDHGAQLTYKCALDVPLHNYYFIYDITLYLIFKCLKTEVSGKKCVLQHLVKICKTLLQYSAQAIRVSCDN